MEVIIVAILAFLVVQAVILFLAQYATSHTDKPSKIVKITKTYIILSTLNGFAWLLFVYLI